MCTIQHECSCIVATLCEEYFEDMKALGILEPDVVTLGSSQLGYIIRTISNP